MTVRDDRPGYEARVVAVSRVTPHMVRVTLGAIGGLDGSRLPDAGPADEFFGLWVPVPGAQPVKRYYTVRHHRADRGEIDVDLLLHGAGPATEWAARAAVGDTVAFDAPRGHYAPPPDTSSLLLCGDATALPALGRILEERLPHREAPPATLVIGVDDPADRSDLAVRPGDDVLWCSSEDLVDETRRRCGVDPTAYVWFSGEAADMRAVRARLRRELGIPAQRWTTMGYWRRDSERWSARLDAAGPAFKAAIDEVLAAPVDEETQADLLEELLSSKGLL
ncbi:MAG: NADPH-dependent ferric siderophore reductase [Microbacterium sp.]|jgi:NADPH-dependent ferric siderophore reductase|nr:NADPH-dependent ferric siderophore reductase [Microbacterium sp.]